MISPVNLLKRYMSITVVDVFQCVESIWFIICLRTRASNQKRWKTTSVNKNRSNCVRIWTEWNDSCYWSFNICFSSIYVITWCWRQNDACKFVYDTPLSACALAYIFQARILVLLARTKSKDKFIFFIKRRTIEFYLNVQIFRRRRLIGTKVRANKF